jgi:hypothetical protein
VKNPEQNNQRPPKALQSRKATALPHTGILPRGNPAILLNPSILSILSKKFPPLNTLSQKQQLKARQGRHTAAIHGWTTE